MISSTCSGSAGFDDGVNLRQLGRHVIEQPLMIDFDDVPPQRLIEAVIAASMPGSSEMSMRSRARRPSLAMLRFRIEAS